MPIIETALTRLLGIEHPILLAPMGSAAGGKLAAAVTNAGGLGLVGSGYASTDSDQEGAGGGRQRAGRHRLHPVGAGAKPGGARRGARRPPGRGHAVLRRSQPRSPAGSRQAGCKIICQVQTLAQAKEAAEAGADIIIAQGRDAGGHSGTTRGTIGLVPAVVDAVAPIPVVAAGGIADGRGLAAALALGAAGISMGTRFTASRESLWDPAMKAAALAAGGDQTQQTRVFDIVRGAPWPAIYPGRALRNEFSADWHGREDELAARQAEGKRPISRRHPTISPRGSSGPARASTSSGTSRRQPRSSSASSPKRRPP